MSDHAFLSPSAASRWLACPASPFKERALSDTSSEAARVGTAAHQMFELAMQHPDRRLKGLIGRVADNGVEYTLEMAKHISKTRKEVSQFYPRLAWRIEKRVPIWKAFEDVSAAKGELWGTADLIGATSDTLIVADLKYGVYSVSPKDNLQLSLYAIGAAHLTGWRHPYIDIVILQPRTGVLFKRAQYTRKDLRVLRNKLAANLTLLFTKGEQSTPNPGAHCFFCKARDTCPERKEKRLANVLKDFLD